MQEEFRVKMADNGRIVIPMACRQLLGIQSGEDLIIRVEDHELRLFSLKHSLQKARSIVQKHAKNKSLVKQLKIMRKSDAEHE